MSWRCKTSPSCARASSAFPTRHTWKPKSGSNSMTRAPEQRAEQPVQPWSVPVALHEVPETGRSFALVADERTRAAIAKLAGLRALPRLEAHFEVMRRGRDGLHVTGTIAATVGQDCVVTLEPIASEIEEPVDLAFAPPVAPTIV